MRSLKFVLVTSSLCSINFDTIRLEREVKDQLFSSDTKVEVAIIVNQKPYSTLFGAEESAVNESTEDIPVESSDVVDDDVTMTESGSTLSPNKGASSWSFSEEPLDIPTHIILWIQVLRQ